MDTKVKKLFWYRLIILVGVGLVFSSCNLPVMLRLDNPLDSKSPLYSPPPGSAVNYRYFMYVGDCISSSVFKYEIDLASGNLTNMQAYSNSVGSADSLAIDPIRRQLYAASIGGHAVSVFPISADGSLGGVSPCVNVGDTGDRLIIHPNGNWLYGVSYSGLFTFDVAGVMNLTFILPFFTPPTADTILFDNVMQPAGNFLFALYRGSGNLATLSVNPSTGALAYVSEVASTDPGSNSINVLVMHPSLPALYVVSPSQVNSYSINQATGALTFGQSDYTYGNSRGLAVDPLGKFLFCANQASTPLPNDPINVYAINQTTGQIIPNGGTVYGSGTASGYGDYHILAIDPTGSYLYDYTGGLNGSNQFQIFAINRTSGALTQQAPIITFPGYLASPPVFLRLP